MKRFLMVVMTLAMWVPLVEARGDASVGVDENETALLKVFGKYQAVFRLLPARVSQVLQVVKAYPSTSPARKAELLQDAIQRLHSYYCTLQQLQERLVEVKHQANPERRAGTYARCNVLTVAIEKYQINLLSILNLLNAEFVRSAKVKHEHKASDSRQPDAAYTAAKMALNPTKLDVLISLLVTGRDSAEPAQEAASVRGEIKELRQEVCRLSVQLNAKSTASVADESDFSEQVSAIEEASRQVASAARQAAEEGAAAEAAGADKQTMDGLVPLRDRAIAFHTNLSRWSASVYTWSFDAVARVGEWLRERWEAFITLPGISEVHGAVSGLIGRVFSDTQKAAKHVEHKMKEVKDATPGGVGLVKEGVCSFFDWIVDSWVRVGNFVWDLLQQVPSYWAALQEQWRGMDDLMREVACNVCAFSNRMAQAAVDSFWRIEGAARAMVAHWRDSLLSPQAPAALASAGVASEASVAEVEHVGFVDRVRAVWVLATLQASVLAEKAKAFAQGLYDRALGKTLAVEETK